MDWKRNSPKTLEKAAHLRHDQTKAEKRLWTYLRQHRLAEVHFRRQHPVGAYIVDFCAPRKKLIIELDGGQHLDRVDYDQERTEFLESRGYRVLRFWNNEVLEEIDAVLLVVLMAMEEG